MPSGTRRENPVAIAHLHTTLNKSRDEKLIRADTEFLSLLAADSAETVIWTDVVTG